MCQKQRWKSCGRKKAFLTLKEAYEHAVSINSRKPGEKKRQPYVCYNHRDDMPGVKEHWHAGRCGRHTRPNRRRVKTRSRFTGKRARYATGIAA